MRKVLFMFLAACLVATGSTTILAQEHPPSGPPKVLVIVREEVKPGRGPAHEKVEAAWARAFSKGKYPAHYIAMTSVSGPNQAWFVEGHDSLASTEQAEQFIEKNAALKAEIDQIQRQDGELLAGSRSIVAVYREELGYRATGVNIGQMRYFYVTTVRVRPGHQDDFIEWSKIIRAAHEQANVPEHWAVFQVTLGMPAGTYVIFQPLKSLTEVDAFAQTHGKAYQDATGDEGRKKLRELASAGLLSSETNIFAFSPKMSYVSEETASADPDFWTPKPVAKTAPAAKKEAGKPKAKP